MATKTWTSYEDLALATHAIDIMKTDEDPEKAVRQYAKKSGRTINDVQKRWNEVVRIKYSTMIQKAIRREIDIPEQTKTKSKDLTVDAVIEFLQANKKTLEDEDSEYVTNLELQLSKLQADYNELLEKYNVLNDNLENLKKVLN